MTRAGAAIVLIAVLGAIAAEVLLFAAGASWFMLATGFGLTKALSLTVLPFLAGEVLKVAAASAVAVRAKKAFSL